MFRMRMFISREGIYEDHKSREKIFFFSSNETITTFNRIVYEFLKYRKLCNSFIYEAVNKLRSSVWI